MRVCSISLLKTVLIFAFFLSLVACGSSSSSPDDSDGTDAAGDAGSDLGSDAEHDSDGDQIQAVIVTSVDVVENFRSVLSAIVMVETSAPARCYVEYGTGTDYGLTTGSSTLDTTHEITVVNMRADTLYHFRVVGVADEGHAYSEDLEFTTGALPSDVPEFSTIVSDADAMQPGVTLFGPGMAGRGREGSPYYLGVDEAGEVVWYYRLEGDVSRFNDRDVTMMPDGNLLATMQNGFAVISVGGQTLLDVDARDLDYERFHHDVTPMPDGGFMVLSEETKMLDVDWDTSPDPVAVTGDLIVEIGIDGEVVWEWSAFDHVDNNRFPTMLSRQAGEGQPFDWTHSNSVTYLEDDDSILVSMRHQHWVVKIDHGSGDIVWRLGDGGDFSLANEDAGDGNLWFYAQHAPEIQEDGSILIYDNGNDRPDTIPPELFSRAVTYRFDKDANRAEQLWSYQTDYFTNFLGDADRLGNGNVLICAGGQPGLDRPAQIVEVTGDQDPEEVWRLDLLGYNIYRATRLDSFYPPLSRQIE